MYTVTVPEDAPIGTVVLRPVSNDRDSSSNKELTFAITSGNDQVDEILHYLNYRTLLIAIIVVEPAIRYSFVQKDKRGETAVGMY